MFINAVNYLSTLQQVECTGILSFPGTPVVTNTLQVSPRCYRGFFCFVLFRFFFSTKELFLKASYPLHVYCYCEIVQQKSNILHIYGFEMYIAFVMLTWCKTKINVQHYCTIFLQSIHTRIEILFVIVSPQLYWNFHLTRAFVSVLMILI